MMYWCDSGLVIVVFITLALLVCVAWLLFYDFYGPCDQAVVNTTVGWKKLETGVSGINTNHDQDIAGINTNHDQDIFQ